MNCHEFERLIDQPGPMSAEAAKHLRHCEICSRIHADRSGLPDGSAAAALSPAAARIEATVLRGLKPVRPLPSNAVLMVQIALPVLGIGGGIGVMTGASGWDAMTLLQRVALLGGLGAGVWMLARASAHLMVPGSSPGWIRPGVAGLLSLGFFALILPFFPLDPDSIPPRLNAVCFRAAFVMSIPAAVAGYLVLRRGARFGRERLGWTLGLLAGLAGALAVQLHCPVLELSHIAFGHVLPVAIGGVAGLAAGAVIRRLEPA